MIQTRFILAAQPITMAIQIYSFKIMNGLLRQLLWCNEHANIRKDSKNCWWFLRMQEKFILTQISASCNKCISYNALFWKEDIISFTPMSKNVLISGSLSVLLDWSSLYIRHKNVPQNGRKRLEMMGWEVVAFYTQAEVNLLLYFISLTLIWQLRTWFQRKLGT